MANILHEFTVKAEASRIFECVSTPAGLDQWWTHSSSGRPQPGEIYALGFGPEYDWEARVSRCAKDAEFELEMTEAADEWQDTRVGFRLLPLGDHTQVSFWHKGWKEETHHFGTTSLLLGHVPAPAQAPPRKRRSGSLRTAARSLIRRLMNRER
jgi:uncharacterized protein YndB with AHSA1/START domain